MAKRLYENPLTSWIKHALSDPDKPNPCTSLTIVKEVRGGVEDVHSKQFTTGIQWNPSELADSLYSICKENCKHDRGLEHRYKIMAFYGGSDYPEASKSFVITPYGSESDPEFLDDAPNAKGALAQGMRLTEALVQGSFKIIAQTIGSTAEENKSLREENRAMFTMLKDAIVKIAETEHDRDMKKLQFERSTEERRMWMTYVPLLVNTVLDKEVFPQSAVDTTIVNAVADNLSIEDLQLLSTKLPPHLWGPLAARIEKFMKEKNAQQAAEKRSLTLVKPGLTNEEAEANAVGDD